MAQLQQSWERAYSIVLDPHPEPSDALRGRVWREFAKRTMSVIEAKKIKSLLAQSAPVSSETVKLQDSSRGAISLSFAREPDAQIKDVASYYFALRMLRAFCGFFLAKTRMALSASSSISVRVGFSGMMCLQGGRWCRPRSPRGSCRMSPRVACSGADGVPQKRQVSFDDEAPLRQAKMSRLSTVSMLKAGIAICKGFNDVAPTSVTSRIVAARATIGCVLEAAVNPLPPPPPPPRREP